MNVLFWAIILLNISAIALSAMWLTAHPDDYEPFVVLISLLANLGAMFYSRPHWTAKSSTRVITQTGNTAGRDVVGGDIVNSEAQRHD